MQDGLVRMIELGPCGLVVSAVFFSESNLHETNMQTNIFHIPSSIQQSNAQDDPTSELPSLQTAAALLKNSLATP